MLTPKIDKMLAYINVAVENARNDPKMSDARATEAILQLARLARDEVPGAELTLEEAEVVRKAGEVLRI